MTSDIIEFSCKKCGKVNMDMGSSNIPIEDSCPHCKENPHFTPEEEKAVHRVNDIPPETFTAIAAWAMVTHNLCSIERKLCFDHPRDIDIKLKGRRRINGYTALTLIKAYDKAFELGFKIQY